MSDTSLAALADRIRQLVEPTNHIETYRILSTTSQHGRNYLTRTHHTNHPSLLDQLRECRYDRAQTEQEAANHPAKTVPHIDIDAIDRLDAIRDATQTWVTHFEIESRPAQIAAAVNRHATTVLHLFGDIRQTPREIVRACALLRAASADVTRRFDLDLPALVGAAAIRRDDSDTIRALTADTGRWITWCRVFAGWETPPWRPRARCPHCDTAAGVDGDQPAGLRVRLDIRSAVCMTCSATWSDDDGAVPIELLAEHIRQTTDLPLSAEQAAALRDPGKQAIHQNRGGKA